MKKKTGAIQAVENVLTSSGDREYVATMRRGQEIINELSAGAGGYPSGAPDVLARCQGDPGDETDHVSAADAIELEETKAAQLRVAERQLRERVSAIFGCQCDRQFCLNRGCTRAAMVIRDIRENRELK